MLSVSAMALKASRVSSDRCSISAERRLYVEGPFAVVTQHGGAQGSGVAREIVDYIKRQPGWLAESRGVANFDGS